MKIKLELELEDEILTGKQICERFNEFQYAEFIQVTDLKKGEELSRIIIDNIYYIESKPRTKFYVIMNGDLVISDA